MGDAFVLIPAITLRAILGFRHDLKVPGDVQAANIIAAQRDNDRLNTELRFV